MSKELSLVENGLQLQSQVVDFIFFCLKFFLMAGPTMRNVNLSACMFACVCVLYVFKYNITIGP